MIELLQGIEAYLDNCSVQNKLSFFTLDSYFTCCKEDQEEGFFLTVSFLEETWFEIKTNSSKYVSFFKKQGFDLSDDIFGNIYLRKKMENRDWQDLMQEIVKLV